MTAVIRRLAERTRSGQGGFTLVELLVASSIFLALSGLMFTLVLSGARTMKNTRQYNDLNEEARLVINRMSREIREAKNITTVMNPGGTDFLPDQDSSITFEVDFDGDGTIEPNAGDPEEITYYYSHSQERLFLQAGGIDYPILADNVTAFRLDFTSSAAYLYDADQNGTTTWEELDADPTYKVGNGSGDLDLAELKNIDSVTITLTVLEAPHQQNYRTTIDLRNRGSI
jgi:prepilin-type N-terminal cleavage/methylation domain-containing protein